MMRSLLLNKVAYMFKSVSYYASYRATWDSVPSSFLNVQAHIDWNFYNKAMFIAQ